MVRAGQPFPAAANACRCSSAPTQTQPRGSQALVPGCSCCSGQRPPGTGGLAAPSGSVVTSAAAHPCRISTQERAASRLALLFSEHLPEALPHTPKLGGKRVTCPEGSRLCPRTNHSSAPVGRAGSHPSFPRHSVLAPARRWLGHTAGTDPETSLPLRASPKAQPPLRVSPGNKPGHLLPLAVWSGLRRSPMTRSGGVKCNLQACGMEQGTGRELSRKYFAENKTFKAFQQQSTENRLQTPREGEWEKVRSGGERGREGEIKRSTTTLGKKGAQRLPKIF